MLSDKTDAEVDTMIIGEFYYYMLNKNHTHWARHCNRQLKLGLSADQEDSAEAAEDKARGETQ